MIEVAEFRDGMARLGGAVSVITTQGHDEACGMTASAVCSVTDAPPTLLVCINRNAWVHNQFLAHRTLCVNVLGARHQALSGHFADRQLAMAQRFAKANWTTLATGAPVLEEALVNFDCRITDSHTVGSHTVFYCAIDAIRLGENHGALVYFNRGYHQLGQPVL